MLHETVTGTLTEAAFEIALIPGNYDFLFWADYGKGAYTTDNLRQVSLVRTPYTPGNDRDAFACVLANVRWNGGNGVGAIIQDKRTVREPITEVCSMCFGVRSRI